jgi:hypothetical protein
MRVLINIKRDLALACVLYYMNLNDGEPIKSKKQFKEELKTYALEFGRMCIDDHEYEGGIYADAAEETLSKYFN